MMSNAELKLAPFFWDNVLLFGESFHTVCYCSGDPPDVKMIRNLHFLSGMEQDIRAIDLSFVALHTYNCERFMLI